MLIGCAPAILCAMPVLVHETPNPNARKYVMAGQLCDRPVNYSSAEAAAASPLAERLFRLHGVYNVFFAQDFVTVNKRPDVPWEALEPQVLSILEAVSAAR